MGITSHVPFFRKMRTIISPTTRMFYYRTEQLWYGWRRGPTCEPTRREAAAAEAMGGLLRCLARGADTTTPVCDVNVSSTLPRETTLLNFALKRLFHRHAPRNRETLTVCEALLPYATTDKIGGIAALVNLWDEALSWDPLMSLLVRRRVYFPVYGENGEFKKYKRCRCSDTFAMEIEWDYMSRKRWEHVRSARAEKRRRLHARNVFLGGRGPPVLCMDVWKVIFAYSSS